jgi:hypothetical protein
MVKSSKKGQPDGQTRIIPERVSKKNSETGDPEDDFGSPESDWSF